MKHNPSDWTLPTNAIVPQVATADVTSAAIDTKGWTFLVAICQLGDMGASATMAWKLTECATSGGTYTDVPNSSVAATGTDNTQAVIECLAKNRLRYMKVVGTYGGSGNAPVQATVLRAEPDTMASAIGAANVTRC